MTRASPIHWTPDRLSYVQDQLKLKATHRQIGDYLFPDIPSDAARTRVRKLVAKLKLGPPPKVHCKPPSKPIAAPPRPRVGNGGASALGLVPAHGCSFPHGHPGKPGFGFCEKPKRPGRPYCGEHWDMTHQPIRGPVKP